MRYSARKRTFGRKLRRADGFGVLELMMATIVLALVLMGFAAVMFASAGENVRSERRTQAQQIATSEIESLRGLRYDQVATVGGNPPGTLPPVKTVDGYQVKTKVGFVADNVPGTYQTYKDYKSVKVTVTRPGLATPLANFETKIAPPGAPGANEAVIKTTVADLVLSTPISGATVDLRGGPSTNRSDVTSAAGEVIFPGLIPNTDTATTTPYDLTVTADGYVTAPADLPPANQARLRVAPTSVAPTAIHMFKPVTLGFSLLQPNGGGGGTKPMSSPATVYVTGTRDAGTIVVPAGGVASTSTMAGQPIVPNDEYTVCAFAASTPGRGWFSSAVTEHVPPDYPNVLTSSFNLLLDEYDLGFIKVIVRDNTNKPIVGARVTVSGGPADVSFTGTTQAGGVLTFTVPQKNGSNDYTVTFPAQSTYSEKVLNSDARGTTSVVNLTVTP